MTATVRYNRIASEEAALKLVRQMRDFGLKDAAMVYDPDAEQSVQLGDTFYSWDHINKLCQFGDRVTLKVTRLPHGADLDLPRYETNGAAGMDLRAAIPEDEVITLLPGQRKLVPTGLAFACPPGYEVQVRPRSGLALKHGISIVNAPGTVDSDYRGEVGCVLINQGQEAFSIRRGDRIGQMVVCPVVQAVWDEVDALDETERGAGGYGSTGRG